MKIIAALIWKEWRHARWFLLGGLAVFVGVPLLPTLGEGLSSDLLESFILAFGWVFAIFTATGLFCSDLEERLRGFWQSRPLSMWKWMLAKYFTGLVCVLAVCLIPVIVMLILRFLYPPQWKSEAGWAILFYVSYTITLIYSLSVLISCLVRKTTHAAILSVAAGLLVFCLPLLLPALESVSVLNLITRGHQPRLEWAAAEKVGASWVGAAREQWSYYFGSPHWLWLRLPGSRALVFHYFPGYWTFVAVMLALSIAAVLLSILALKRHWKVRMDQKLLFWALGFTALLLFASGAFAIGSNLEPEEVIQLPKFVLKSTLAGNEGIFVLGTPLGTKQRPDHSIVRFHYDDQYEEEIFSWRKSDLGSIADMAWSPDRPDTLWVLLTQYEENEGNYRRTLRLMTLRLNPDTQTAESADERILGEHVSRENSVPGGADILLYRDHLYTHVLGKLIVLDVGKPQSPQIAVTFDNWYPVWEESGSSEGVTKSFRLIDAEGLSPEEQAFIAADLEWNMSADENMKTAAEISRDYIRLFRLSGLENGRPMYRSFAQRTPTPLERLLGGYPRQSLFHQDWLYVISEANTGSGSLMIYHVESDGTIRRAKHFVRPNDRFENVSRLDDGRILLTGIDKIYILPSPVQ